MDAPWKNPVNQICKKSESELCYDRRSVGQYVFE
jgi:hypothetical protein